MITGPYITLIFAVRFLLQKSLHHQRLVLAAAEQRSSSAGHPWIEYGLWSCSRNPHYFGEILMCCGMALLCCGSPASAGLHDYHCRQWILLSWLPDSACSLRIWWCLSGPLCVWLHLQNLSDAKDASNRKKWQTFPQYAVYCRETPLLLPALRTTV